ncbi:response regulator transcription factor [Clostridium formicaceticum]|uniref:Stage 0 sporulation protein A homolog n=1 Tax=Clostridium formicaceticum TaxID=1497 RepID=A0AAC9RPM9_9CLOT|nr:helix-turn-helix domain-containing protein [Clostridium formicaceticum]AOY74611.1 DNA-binding response regulator [Clostridium formicaceticum]ARE88975.1 putative response regulatory protein [Clostridium formicaceticum]
MNVILIVEDEILEQEFLKTVMLDELLPEDTILTCGSGVQAVQLAKQHRPNIIIMDIMISEMDGLTAAQEIRGFLPNACITILSAYSDFSYAQKAINLRVFEYLLKPVKPTAFKEVFRKMLESASKSSVLVEEKPEEKSAKTKDDRQHFVEESIKYIKEHFREKLTLEMVASKVFMNPKYFSHVFKREMGISFTEYIIQLRIQYACRLLETTNYPAYRISSECGFSDPSYFNRVFCGQMNMTPQTYRKNVYLTNSND